MPIYQPYFPKEKRGSPDLGTSSFHLVFRHKDRLSGVLSLVSMDLTKLCTKSALADGEADVDLMIGVSDSDLIMVLIPFVENKNSGCFLF